MTYDQFDVVVVPFPFTDKAQTKRRPALVLSAARSFNKSIEQSVMAMITRASHAPWPLDVAIKDLTQAGLPFPSIVRMKLFTLDHQFVVRKTGSLGPGDQELVSAALHHLLNVPSN